MPYGLKDIELAKLNEVFAANERIERVVLYGSRAKGNYKPFSDVDITLEGAKLTHTDLNRISLAIDDLLLPYQFDISIFHTLNNEALIDHIRRMGITVYEKKSEWKEYKLGEIVSIASGFAYKGEHIGEGESLLLGMGCVSYKEKFLISGARPYAGDCAERYLANVGDIVLATRQQSDNLPILGMPAIIPEELKDKKLIVGANLYRVTNNSDFDNRYIYWLLKTPAYVKHIASCKTGTTVGMITKADIENFVFTAPDRTGREQILEAISSLDDKIDLLHRENATLEQMAETLFRQWFVVEAKEEWEDVLLGNLIDIGSGKGLQRSEFVENGLYSVLGANGDIGKTNKYLFDESNRVIYTGRVGTLGNVFRLENKKAWLSDNTLVIKPKEYYNFVYFVLKLSRLQDYNVGSTQPLIRQSDIKEIELVLPDRGILNAFEKECDLIYEKVENNNKQIQTLIQTRDGLLPRLMGGEVKIL